MRFFSFLRRSFLVWLLDEFTVFLNNAVINGLWKMRKRLVPYEFKTIIGLDNVF